MTGSTDFAIGIDGVPDGFAPATARGLENVVARYQRQGGKTPPHLSCNRDSMRALVASLGGDGAPCETEPLAAWRGIPVFIDEGAAGGIIRATAPMDAPEARPLPDGATDDEIMAAVRAWEAER